MSEERRERQRVREQRVIKRDQLQRLGTLMSDPIGRSYIYDLLASCHIFATSFRTNAMAMAFSEGERNVGLRLVSDLTEAAPDRYLQMLKEGGYVGESRNRNDDNGDASGDGTDNNN